MLDIPHLGTVPRRLRAHRVNPITAHAALALLDCGALPATARSAPPAELVNTALRGWIDRAGAGMRNIQLNVAYHEHDENGAPRIGLYFRTDPPWPLNIGAKLEALQKAVPGLGETVLWHLDHDLPSPLEIFTPSCALMAAQWTQWGGCDDEEARLAELRDEGEDPADYEILPRKLFDKVIPRWASTPRERIKVGKLRAIAKRRGLAGQVAAAVLDLHKLDCSFEGSDDGRRYWPPAAALCWRASDRVTMRLIDDLGNDYFDSGEYIEHFTEIILTVPQIAQGLPDGLSTAETMVAALRAADRVLQLIGSRV